MVAGPAVDIRSSGEALEPSQDDVLALLRRGPDGIRHWNAVTRLIAKMSVLEASNLRELDLRGVVFSGMRLSGVDLANADLRGANLRAAELDHADLGASQLEYADLSDVELSGANLAGAKGLTQRTLAGAVLESCTLPSDFKFLALDVANALSRSCRSLFLALLAALLYCLITVGTTSPAALWLDIGSSKLPIVLADVPFASFYVFAPWLLLGLYIYFHLHLQRLWNTVASLPAVFPDGSNLDETLHPWVPNCLIALRVPRLRARSAKRRRPWVRLEWAVSVVMAWIACPFVLVVMVWAVTGHRMALSASAGAMVGIIFAWSSYRRGVQTLTRRRVTTTRLGRALGRLALFVFAASVPLATAGLSSQIPRPIFAYAAQLQGRKLEGLDLRSAYLPRANLESASLEGAWLHRAVLYGAQLDYANLDEAIGVQANFTESSLPGASLSDSTFALANFRGANLRGAVLYRSNFQETNLSGADFEGAHLDDAIFSGADLRGANLSGASMHHVRYDDTTRWPENFDPKTAGAQLVDEHEPFNPGE